MAAATKAAPEKELGGDWASRHLIGKSLAGRASDSGETWGLEDSLQQIEIFLLRRILTLPKLEKRGRPVIAAWNFPRRAIVMLSFFQGQENQLD